MTIKTKPPRPEGISRRHLGGKALTLWVGLIAGFPCRLQADMVSAIARIKPSVVIVGTYNALENPRFQLRGTGFVAGHGNWAVTNAHVIPEGVGAGDASETASRLVVQVRTGPTELSMRQATVLELDPTHDLALLRFEGPAVPILAIRDSQQVQEGQTVGLIGFPIGGALGFSPVTHRGMISSITTVALPTPTGRQLNARAVRALREGNFQVFQLDATAYPGNSGGPLFDIDSGEVLGVVNMVFVKGSRESALTNPSGITYAIPSNFVQLLLQRNMVK